MDLILWRHAEAEEGGPDLERCLTSRGHKHAQRVAKWLLQRLPSKCTIVTSPARRARQTADALGIPYRTTELLAPGASVAEALEAAGWPDRRSAVLVVGHQPTLGMVAAHLLSGARAEWTIKKGGLWWLSNRLRDDEARIVVRAVVAPDVL